MKTKLQNIALNPNLLLEPSFHQKNDKYQLWQLMRDTCPMYAHHHPDFPICYSITRYEDVKKSHENSQSLQVGIDLTEGQLGTDRDFEFYIKEAVVNKMLNVWKDK